MKELTKDEMIICEGGVIREIGSAFGYVLGGITTGVLAAMCTVGKYQEQHIKAGGIAYKM